MSKTAGGIFWTHTVLLCVIGVDLYKFEAESYNGSEQPVGQSSETHSTRTWSLSEQLSTDHHWYWTYRRQRHRKALG